MSNSERSLTLPGSIRDFVERQATLPLERLFGDRDTPCYPYGEYWRRAVAAMLLSGRVAAKADGFPNMTDVNRICKEANFDQYLFQATGRFLVTAKIIQPDEQGSRYEPAKFSDAFWNHQLYPLRETACQAFLELVQQFTPFRVWRPTFAIQSALDGLVALFTAAFQDVAIPEDQAGHVLLEFSKLPSSSLIDLGRQLGFKDLQYDTEGWESWLDEPGQRALLSALYFSGWAHTTNHRKRNWVFLNDTARIILGLAAPPESAAPALDFRVLPNLCVLAGADLPPEKLLPLFRHCKIKRIDRVFEFHLDKRQLTDTNSLSSVGKLRELLEESGPLPATADSLLRHGPFRGGEIRIRGCSAIVQAENAEVLDAIRQHSRLKGYLESWAPKGYLLIKQGSNPANFVQRSKALGFRFTLLQR